MAGVMEMNSSNQDGVEELFSNIGKYIILFQYMESIVDECLLLMWGHKNWEASQDRLVGMTNRMNSPSKVY